MSMKLLTFNQQGVPVEKFIYFWCAMVVLIGFIAFLPIFLIVACAYGLVALLAMIG